MLPLLCSIRIAANDAMDVPDGVLWDKRDTDHEKYVILDWKEKTGRQST